MIVRTCVVLLLLSMLFCSRGEAGTTMKVLILDDVFQATPAKNEKIERMGKLKGDLLGRDHGRRG